MAFPSLFGEADDSGFFGSQMRAMRMNMMNMMDPFRLLEMGGAAGGGGGMPGGRMDMGGMGMLPFGMPMPPMAMPGLNRLLGGGSLGAGLDALGGGLGGLGGGLGGLGGMGGLAAVGGGMGGHCYSSSTMVSMSSGPDGRPQVYKATSSTRCAPGGIKETKRTVSDSTTGTRKMAIGHHIGERAHIIEKEQNSYTGDREEREDFINLEEEEADEFNREWETKARRSEIPRITGVSSRNRHSYGGHSSVPAITAGSSIRRHRERHGGSSPIVTPRRSYRSSPLALPPASAAGGSLSSSSASSRTPYSAPGLPAPRRQKNMKTVSGAPSPTAHN